MENMASSGAARRKGPVRRGKSRKKSSSQGAEKKQEFKGYQISAVAKALDLLEVMCQGGEGGGAGGDEFGVTELSRQLGLQKAAVFRLLMTFETRGYIEREEASGLYRIGMNAFEVSRKLLSRLTVLRQARPVMEELCRRCNEAVYLAVRRGGDFLLIDVVEGSHQVKVASLMGKRFPLTSGAPGRLMLALSEPSNIASTAADTSFEAIRRQGYCVDHGGLGELVGSLAAPLFNGGGAVAGALCIVTPSYRMTQEQVESTLLPSLKEAGEAVSAKLGDLRPHGGRVRL